MKILITRRADGCVKIGDYVERHKTGIPYGNDEIVKEAVVEIPEAYRLDCGGFGYKNKYGVSPIQDHPKIRAAMKKL